MHLTGSREVLRGSYFTGRGGDGNEKERPQDFVPDIDEWSRCLCTVFGHRLSWIRLVAGFNAMAFGSGCICPFWGVFTNGELKNDGGEDN